MSMSEEAGGGLALQTESSKTWIIRIVDGDIVATRIPYLMSSVKGLTRISQSAYSFYHYIEVIIAIRYRGSFDSFARRHACCGLGESLRVGQA